MTKLLIIVVLILGVIAIAQLASVGDLTARLSGRREENIPERENRMNARLFWIFGVLYAAFIIWLLVAYGDEVLTVSASKHGVATDKLLNVNWVILFIAFIITNTLLFFFAGKYYFRKDRKALYYPHNNKLELLWTVVPAIVLAGIIIYGLNVWNGVTASPSEDSMDVELYSKQFDWTARYPGVDGKLGATDFRLINGTNPLGVVTEASIATRLLEIEEEAKGIKSDLENRILPDETMEELEDDLESLIRTKKRIIDLRTIMQNDIKEKGDNSTYLKGSDDIVIKEFHLPVHQEVNLVFRSQDVIHSAYMPHLRTQMNCVPGVTTTFKVTPIITTDSMRLIEENEEFNFVLLCNKICGASHYNMQMNLLVEQPVEFQKWIAEQKPFEGGEEPKAIETAAVEEMEAVEAELTEVDN
jgi:cytochrome c oxidase subunit 2